MKIQTASILPEHIYTKELLLSSAAGAGIGALAGYLFNRRRRKTNRLKKVLLGAAIGGLGGAGANIAWQKLKERLGGRYVGRRQSLPDLSKNKEINVYMHGADTVPLTFRKNREAHSNTAFFGWDERADAIDYIKKLPEDITVNIIGHSYGADSAYDVASALGDRIASVRLLEPTGIRGHISSAFGLPINAPYKGLKNYIVELAGNAGNDTAEKRLSNLWAAVGGRYPARNITGTDIVTYPTDSHKLESTSHRLY